MKKAGVIIMLSVFIVACPTTSNSEFDFDKFYADFQNQKLAWENLKINHYRYTWESPTTGGDPALDIPPITIMVFPDREPEITDIAGLPATAELIADLGADKWIRIPTIDGLYSSFEWNILYGHSNLRESPHFKGYEILYNKDYHYPEYFGVRWVKGVNGGFGPTRITTFEDLRRR
jgi:hypothetical protein